MPVKQLALTAKQKRFIASEVKAGRYRSESEVLMAGLDLLARQQRAERKRQALRELIQPAIDQIDAGKGVTIKNKAELTAFMKQMTDRAKQEVEQEAKKA